MLEDQPVQRITSSEVVTQLERIPIDQQLFTLLKKHTNPSEEEIKPLIDQGFDLNCVDENGLTPFLYLIQKKLNTRDNPSLLEFIQFLIENGINVYCEDNNGCNVLHPLCSNYRNENLIDIIRLLIKKGIDVYCRGDCGWNALICLCQNYENENLIDIIRLLIENEFEVTSETLNYFTTFYNKGNRDEVLHLLEKVVCT
jgi:ankyrin repeat protein